MREVICPVCGLRAIRTDTRYGPRHDHCGLWSWRGAPLVDRETHEARKAAHRAIDHIWKSRKLSRSEVYRRLGILLGLQKEECHMKQMDAKMARKARDSAPLILEDTW